MKLYYAETLNPRKACAVAKYLNAPVEFVHVDLTKGEQRNPSYLAINPNGKVPALQDGENRIWESNAIMCYLAQAAGSDIWPNDRRQTEVLRWLSWDGQHFTRHAGTLYFEHVIKPIFALGPPDEAATKEATGYVLHYGHILNEHLRGRAYLLGDVLTIADFAVAVTLPYAELAKIPIKEFPEVQRWHGRLNELAAWREPFSKASAAA
ncbi:glutathione S-transferase family protein [Bradyrhizobium sp. LHD-71]|uniref:glutathione S-transferase family protein n=1 Tax=Bradyrhizobium sp. LHD-71 TaxID=3072141 RepID=UPI00281045AF|nr:glutathione S-transferase family protein [Bradyrhizobium sp. LHD-71]MDQ8730592.1 glutathione S-transferase family protein [Bradyrhizobium sp. LHD-71]